MKSIFDGLVANRLPAADAQVLMEEGVRSPEVQAVRFNTLGNAVTSWIVRTMGTSANLRARA